MNFFRTHVGHFALSLALFAPISAFAGGDAALGKVLFEQLCVTCHGPTGGGDGPVAASLPPEMRPANMQAAQFKVATDDAKMADVIKKGGAAMGLNPLMPPQATLTDVQIANLIAFVRTLKK